MLCDDSLAKKESAVKCLESLANSNMGNWQAVLASGKWAASDVHFSENVIVMIVIIIMHNNFFVTYYGAQADYRGGLTVL